MDEKKNVKEMLPPELKELVEEINARKARKNAKIQYSLSKKRSKADVIGNVNSCNDEVCGGGIGNVQSCDDMVCNDPDNNDPDCMGNVSSCGDWICK